MRPKGVPNISSMRADYICHERKYNAIESMINAAEIALQKFVEEEDKVNSGRLSPMESKAHAYLETYVKIANNLAQYIYPKRKAIEISQTDALRDMDPVQKLEAMKHAVKMLELQMKKSDGPGNV